MHGGDRTQRGLSFYAAFSGLKWPASYEGRLMLVAFLGTHVPLLALTGYVVFMRTGSLSEAVPYLVVALCATLLGMFATLTAMHLMLRPVGAASDALRGYLSEGTLPNLPTGYRDQAGRLMADVQTAVIHLDGLIVQYRHIASTDEMTGLYNRNAGEKRLAEEIARSTREGHGFMFCFLDLNGFKGINDRHGHAFGDRVLAHVSSILARSLRQGDWCGRWGGDEFVLLLFQSRAVQDAVFQRIGAELAARPLPLEDGGQVRVSVSCGACHYRPGEAMTALIERADAAMYRAKKEAGAGNLRVVFDPVQPSAAA